MIKLVLTVLISAASSQAFANAQMTPILTKSLPEKIQLAGWFGGLDYCEAATVCPNGRPIRCWAQGHSPTCKQVAGQSVYCAGGRGGSYTESCGG